MKTDLIVIGGGILGAFHAYHALLAGHTVRLIEQSFRPKGATVRNFGQVVPSGLPPGPWLERGKYSTELYKSLQSRTDLSVRQNGTIYIAEHEGEVRVLEEMHQRFNEADYPCALLDANQVRSHHPALLRGYPKAALHFPQEVTVEPEHMIHRLLDFMTEQMNLQYHPGRRVLFCEESQDAVMVGTHAGERYDATKVIVCSGAEAKGLFPEVLQDAGLVTSKLQMLDIAPIAERIPGSVLTGLSIRRYESFASCDSWKDLDKNDVDATLLEMGIHILFKQRPDGSVIIGDSHEYAPAHEAEKLGFHTREDIDNAILREAKRIMNFSRWEVRNRWFGCYTQLADRDILDEAVSESIRIITGIGGKGMTTSAGYAKEVIADWF